MEAEKAEVSLQIYEEEAAGEARRDINLVISHDKEHWQLPKSQGVADLVGTSEPFTVNRAPPLKPQVHAIPSLATINYLSGSFMPQTFTAAKCTAHASYFYFLSTLPWSSPIENY